MELITIMTFDNPVDGHLVRSKLESEGIPCVLFDENIVGLNQMYSMVVGGIKLKVSHGDIDKARAILAELEKKPITDEHNQPVMCPRCASTDVYPGFRTMNGLAGFLSAVLSFLFLVFPFYFDTGYRCKKCGTHFKRTDD